MAEEEEFEDDFEVPQKSGNAKLLIIFGLLFVISNGIWGAVIFMKEPAAATKPEEAKAEAAKAEDEKGDDKLEDPLNKPGPIVAFDPFVVNLNETNGGHYLRTTIQIEIDKEESREHVDKRTVMLRDNFLTVLAGKQLDELQSTEDKEKLRGELLGAARKVLSKRSVHAVYFTEFLTQ